MTDPKRECDTLIEARWCLPIEGPEPVLEGHALAVAGGRIEAVLPVAEARARYAPRNRVVRDAHALLPGLVNAHAHAAMTVFRGLVEDLPLAAWLAEGIWPAEKRWVSEELVRDGTRHAIAEMLSAGITCFSDQYFFPEIVAEVAAELQMRAVVATPVIDFATAWAGSGQECLQKAADLVHDPYVDHPLITTAFAPHTTAVVSDATFRALRVMADQLDRRVQIHLHESQSEIDAELASTGLRPLARLERLGLINDALLAVHGVWLDGDEIELLAERGAAIVHCPRSNLKLASGIARLPEWLAAGITVGIGTDSAASNNARALLAETRQAALLAKVSADSAAAVAAASALELATLGGARALGIDDRTGSLLPGKAADIACIRLDTLNSQPLYDPLGDIVYTARAGQVTDCWVAGRHLLAEGRLTLLDEQDVLARSAEWRDRIRAG